MNTKLIGTAVTSLLTYAESACLYPTTVPIMIEESHPDWTVTYHGCTAEGVDVKIRLTVTENVILRAEVSEWSQSARRMGEWMEWDVQAFVPAE